MQLTKEMLTRIIKEELANVLAEQEEQFKISTRGSREKGHMLTVQDKDNNAWVTGMSGAGQESSTDRSMIEMGYDTVHNLVAKANAGDEEAIRIVNWYLAQEQREQALRKYRKDNPNPRTFSPYE